MDGIVEIQCDYTKYLFPSNENVYSTSRNASISELLTLNATPIILISTAIAKGAHGYRNLTRNMCFWLAATSLQMASADGEIARYYQH